jgi:DNA (cytosine-5)-methyltransferase 1
MNHIELFAGCGGLSLGIESAGFELLVANELSPMAAQTYAFNSLGIDLELGDEEGKVIWLKSKFQRKDLLSRLTENPFDLPNDPFCDFTLQEPNNKSLKRSLWVGNIVHLNEMLAGPQSKVRELLKSGLGSGGVDLVSGGPPCQSFSMAGLRHQTNDRNRLPWEFVKFVSSIQPRMALLENVSGILKPFKSGGKLYYAWYEVAKAFAQVGYVPICLHINAKYVGVAQNRPRFILLALREDISRQILEKSKDCELFSALTNSVNFMEDARTNEDLSYGLLQCHDIERGHKIYNHPFFEALKGHSKRGWVSVKDAIDDLNRTDSRVSDYVSRLNSVFLNSQSYPLNKEINHELRRNGPRVRARFRVYQVASRLEKTERKELLEFLRGDRKGNLSKKTLKAIRPFWLLSNRGGVLENPEEIDILSLLKQLRTKKRSQRALNAEEPAPTALSIPDDICHYGLKLGDQRTLSVREMARIQSFPDWFQVKAKVTTGGVSRKIDVPQYTQIGNAVPPLLGLELGRICKNLLHFADS